MECAQARKSVSCPAEEAVIYAKRSTLRSEEEQCLLQKCRGIGKKLILLTENEREKKKVSVAFTSAIR